MAFREDALILQMRFQRRIRRDGIRRITTGPMNRIRSCRADNVIQHVLRLTRPQHKLPAKISNLSAQYGQRMKQPPKLRPAHRVGRVRVVHIKANDGFSIYRCSG
ncbi:hypothetical protein [Aliiroseovarius sp. F20344]|uniref:hypothetical protein n=1 Tax=Aliiroseovarius sp. F20344 TaxID=2926414 RepID=UPI001FF0E3C5|nr:hypothetical protein [Aliiroseovarius sp. F20344]MCK0140953.1 hypothetical protein [Aliiroseovarius sp. F20344]